MRIPSIDYGARWADRRARRRRGAFEASPSLWTLALTVLSVVLLFGTAADAQGTRNPASTPTSTSTSVVPDATRSPVALVESRPANATLAIGSSTPAQFYLEKPFKNMTNPMYIVATLCSGPAIEPYNVSDQNVLDQLDMDYWSAMTSTVPTMYVSTDERNKQPGPSSLLGDPDIDYFFGGVAQSKSDSADDDDGVWVSIYPPVDARGVTGTWTLLISVSSEVQPYRVATSQGLSFADSDRTNALISTYDAAQGTSANLTLAILPSDGPGSLPAPFYFNSSVCAIANAYNSFAPREDNDDRVSLNRSETARGSPYKNTTRVQWSISDLEPATNYTAWLFDFSPVTADGIALSTTTVWPAIKFVTKRSPNCRLVYDVDFCPSVAYSIPIGPGVPTDRALSIINDTVTPNFANFSATLGTFACGSSSFGQYSPLQTCDSCQSAYRDWLCAVTMPRCTDPLPVVDNQTSAAFPNPFDLMGVETPLNSQTLPYVINRRNNSRQAYIDDEDGLDADSYGELLPCIYTCYQVRSSCPQPLMQWYCPIWDITAQSQYGTFADAGRLGLGAGENGGAGQDGQRWGGLNRYISQDNFGNVYCNSMNVERKLLLANAAGPTGRSPPRSLVNQVVASIVVTLSISAISSLCFFLDG